MTNQPYLNHISKKQVDSIASSSTPDSPTNNLIIDPMNNPEISHITINSSINSTSYDIMNIQGDVIISFPSYDEAWKYITDHPSKDYSIRPSITFNHPSETISISQTITP